MHQFIKAYYNSELPLHQISLDRSDPYFSVINLIKEIEASLEMVDSHRAEMLLTVNEFPLNEIADVDVLSFYFISKARLYHSLRDDVNSQMLLERVLLQLNDENKRVIKAQVFIYLGYHSINSDSALMYFDKAIKLFTYEYKREYILMINILMYYAHAGALSLLPSKLMLVAKKSKSKIVEDYLNIVYFIDAVVRGDSNMSEAYLRSIPEESRTSRIYRSMILMHINKGEWNTSLWDDIPDEYVAIGGHLPFVGLHNGKPEETLDFIKNIFSTDDPSRVDFLLRAELANKNLVAAKKLILERSGSGLQSFMENIFLMRIALLEKNMREANYHFHQLIAYGDKHKMHGRINFEFDLSIEIKNSELKSLCFSKPIRKIKGGNHIEKSKELKGIEKFIGTCKAVSTLRTSVKKYAKSDLLVLVQGETGTGKEVVARALHAESLRAKSPYLTINCGAISESLLQTELFGYEKGAFTGAMSSNKGIFEAAAGGTVFLDEIGEISPQVQIALLRVLESNEVRPVGSTKARPLTCRIIMATNADLENLVALGIFRKDLYYRINKLKIQILPLRDRQKDILVLADYFLNINRQDSNTAQFSKELTEAFMSHSWPGNVRELKNEIEKLRFLYSEKSFYELSDWPLLQKNPVNVSGRAVGDKHLIEKQEVQITHGNTPFRRLELIKAMFLKHSSLTIAEISKALDVKSRTIGNDINKLIDQNLIERVCPTPSRRTHYFISKTN